jgi:Dual-action HEIGH metallo-peptidase
MKKIFKTILLVSGLIVAISSCKKGSIENASTGEEKISDATMAKIKALGFSTSGVIKHDGGYLVEGDILLEEADLASMPASPNMLIAENEQYRTNNIVNGLPRTIKMTVSNLPQVYIDATDEAIARYNAQPLRLKFQRVTSGKADITVEGFYQAPSGGFITLGSAGFPKGGNPYRKISMNTHPQAYGTNPNLSYVASVIQHEVGHCIGFRHTDYMNRAYSCGSGGNEGSAGVGAVHIPGTPTGPDSGSWMLACSNGGNRTFNLNDGVALKYLYQ